MGDEVTVRRLDGTGIEGTNVNVEGTGGTLNVFDNLNGKTDITYDREVTAVTTTTRKTTITSQTRRDVAFNLNIVGIYMGIRGDFNLSDNFMQNDVSTSDDEFSETKTVREQITFIVLNGSKTTLTISYRSFVFDYEFDGPTKCLYKFDARNPDDGGVSLGTIFGHEAFDGMITTIDTELAPTAATSLALTAATSVEQVDEKSLAPTSSRNESSPLPSSAISISPISHVSAGMMSLLVVVLWTNFVLD